MTHSHASVGVVVPVYRPDLTPFEQVSAHRCRKILGHYPIAIVAPSSLDVATVGTILDPEQVLRFPDEYFRSTGTYSALLRSPEFYDRCPAWEFALIHQLDAFVFSDELGGWCGRAIDYVGAPWPHFDWLRESRHAWVTRLPIPWRRLGEVGNGGFSLRRLETFRRLSRKWRLLGRRLEINEDLYWSWVIPFLEPAFRVPSAEEARAFAVELSPEDQIAHMGRLPFGAHALERYGREIWWAAMQMDDRQILERIEKVGMSELSTGDSKPVS